MRLGTARTATGTAAFVEGAHEALYFPHPDVAALLADPDWRSLTGTPGPYPTKLAPPVLVPRAFVCAGLNDAEHARELGKSAPLHPTLFAKLPAALVGPADVIELPDPRISTRIDWEAELVAVIGARVSRATSNEAEHAIAGYTAMNDVSVRDWQNRTEEWLQGKNFDRTTPLGPVIVTSDEFDLAAGHAVETFVNGVQKQAGCTADLLFSPAELVAYISTFMTLEPGDLVATGTPAGIGARRTPPEFLGDGDELVTRVTGIGELRNRCSVPASMRRQSRAEVTVA